MSYLSIGICIGLLFLVFLQMARTTRLVKALAETNKSLNEVRELVSAHHKNLSKINKELK